MDQQTIMQTMVSYLLLKLQISLYKPDEQLLFIGLREVWGCYMGLVDQLIIPDS